MDRVTAEGDYQLITILRKKRGRSGFLCTDFHLGADESIDGVMTDEDGAVVGRFGGVLRDHPFVLTAVGQLAKLTSLFAVAVL